MISQRLAPVREDQPLTKISLNLLTTEEIAANIAVPYVISVWRISKQKKQLLFKIFHVFIFEELVFKLLEFI